MGFPRIKGVRVVHARIRCTGEPRVMVPSAAALANMGPSRTSFESSRAPSPRTEPFDIKASTSAMELPGRVLYLLFGVPSAPGGRSPCPIARAQRLQQAQGRDVFCHVAGAAWAGCLGADNFKASG